MGRGGWVLALVFWCYLVGAAAAGQQPGGIVGTVVDPVGAPVAAATVSLMRGDEEVGRTGTAADGAYAFQQLPQGRYQVRATATGFADTMSATVFVGNGTVTIDLSLQVGPVTQTEVVTASPQLIPQSQTGAPVSVIDGPLLQALNKPDLMEALRLVPGAQVHQTGARGGTTSLFIRGGNSNFAKVLIDGIPANDIGGGFDFAQVTTTGVERVEVLRQSNSVMYGADALTGVVSIETRRGRTRVPQLSYTVDGGNLGMFRTALAGGGAVDRFDYFSEYSYFTADNELPNNGYDNRTYAGRFGVQLAAGTDVSGVIRHVRGQTGSPNAFSHYGVADDSSQRNRFTYAGLTATSQWTDRLQTTIRYGDLDQTLQFSNPSPTGEPFDPFGFGANYLGQTVRITGANGYVVSGRAILDFGGTYPNVFKSRTTRRSVWAQASYSFTSDFVVSGGGRVEREQAYQDPESDASTTRDNGGLFLEGRGSLARRIFVSAGFGYERNQAFDPVVTPRFSVASYLRAPTTGALGDTKVSFNAGKGIKAPAVFQVESSLATLLANAGSRLSIEPIAPEKGTSLDIGIEQGLWDGQARVRLAWFRNSYDDLIEFVSRAVLPQVGVPVAVAQATAFGAYVNSQSYEAQGIEASAEARVLDRFRLMGSYTFLDADVTESFSSGALSPAINPAFPGVRIGAFSPLVGERPFRRPAHSGTLLISYASGPAQLTLSAFFSGARDDSTFLSDAFFGNSMLLPNQGLLAAYRKYDLAVSYKLRRRLQPYLSIENLFDTSYEAALGYPSLPRTARVGVRVELGGN